LTEAENSAEKMSRRKYLKLAGGAAAAVVVGGLAAGWYYSSTPKQTAKPIKIGHLADLTGGNAAYGYSETQIARAAVSLINGRGGINGRPLELYVEDTQTDPPTAITRMKKLLDYWNVDFVMGDSHSGCTDSVLPLAKQYSTILFAFAGADEITGGKGNRFVFRLNRNNRQDSLAAARYGLENLGKKWTTFVLDFSAGASAEKWFSDEIKRLGGTILKNVRLPNELGDVLPYVKQIPPESDGVMIFLLPASFTMFMQAFRPLYQKMAVISAAAPPHGFDISNLPPEMQGLYHVTSFPLMLSGLNTTNNIEFRKSSGIDDQGREIGNPKNVFMVTYDWSVWESFFALKLAIEKSSWQSEADNMKVIQALEGMAVKEGPEFPQGDLTIRVEDHQGFPRQFIERLDGKTLNVIATVPSENLVYPVEFDYRKTG
jgi:branched-chain amino acid transport system substrate-binding protein